MQAPFGERVAPPGGSASRLADMPQVAPGAKKYPALPPRIRFTGSLQFDQESVTTAKEAVITEPSQSPTDSQ
jgi:hypothetical protein